VYVLYITCDYNTNRDALISIFDDQILEENKEIDSALSETLNNTDSDAELERELAELEEDNEDVFTAVPCSNPEIEKLEQRLQDLRMEGKYYILQIQYLLFIFHIK